MVADERKIARDDKDAMTLIPYSRQSINNEDVRGVIKVLKSAFITQGPIVEEFESKLAEYCKAKYAVVFNSGTSALHGAYFALGLKEGDEFITTPNTFVATSNAGLYLGAKPVFVDIEEDTGNMDISKIEENVREKTKLIVPVHYAGHPVDLYKIHEIAKRYNLFIVEDACHALGAEYNKEKIGHCRYSDMTVLSFHPVKHITTGEGGAVLTSNEDFYEKLLMFRTHGITKQKFANVADGDWYYEMHFLGYNYRMTDIHAALGKSQLRRLDKFVERRRKIARIYDETFKGNPYFDTHTERDYAFSSWHLYPIRLRDGSKKEKREIFTKMRESGIGVQVHYMPVYLQPYYQGLGYKRGLCPVAEDFYQREISIPIYPAMKDEEVEWVAGRIRQVFSS